MVYGPSSMVHSVLKEVEVTLVEVNREGVLLLSMVLCLNIPKLKRRLLNEHLLLAICFHEMLQNVCTTYSQRTAGTL